jgi:hypothetical protein
MLLRNGLVKISRAKKRLHTERGKEFEVAKLFGGNLKRKEGSETGIPNFPGCKMRDVFGGRCEGDVAAARSLLGGCYVCEFAVFVYPDADCEEIECPSNGV